MGALHPLEFTKYQTPIMIRNELYEDITHTIHEKNTIMTSTKCKQQGVGALVRVLKSIPLLGTLLSAMAQKLLLPL